ncbi:MAG TPA: DUF1538 domain-containing protein [Mariprofundaceae bacterium]|nr:DUF1538 domain-containing protein [Mariprofundaceae bacterium]
MIEEFAGRFGETLVTTLRDVAPIIAVLGFFQFAVLRGPVANPYRVLRGFIYVILGMVLFLMGLEEAIFPLGEVMASQLTDPGFVSNGVEALNGAVNWADYVWVYVFAFAIGLSTTLAEPALIAVGMKAERISGGAISAWGLRVAVSIGVAGGVMVGCFRIVTGTDLWMYIIAAYVVVILQTFFAPRMIIPLAYDSGGVTTSTVTVPLLAALGIGLASSIPGRSPLIDGFGLIAFASVFPIMSVMAYAWFSEFVAKRQVVARFVEEEEDAL